MGKFRFFVLLFASCGESVTGSCSSSRFSWFLRNRERLTTTFRRRRRGIISSRRRRRARTEKRHVYPLFSSSATKRLFQLALCGEQREMRTATTDEMSAAYKPSSRLLLFVSNYSAKKPSPFSPFPPRLSSLSSPFPPLPLVLNLPSSPTLRKTCWCSNRTNPRARLRSPRNTREISS